MSFSFVPKQSEGTLCATKFYGGRVCNTETNFECSFCSLPVCPECQGHHEYFCISNPDNDVVGTWPALEVKT